MTPTTSNPSTPDPAGAEPHHTPGYEGDTTMTTDYRAALRRQTRRLRALGLQPKAPPTTAEDMERIRREIGECTLHPSIDLVNRLKAAGASALTVFVPARQAQRGAQ